VLCGESDVISPPKEKREISAGIPRAKYVEIPETGHMAPLQSPEAVNAELQTFLQPLV
jgi:pimeloyl-ACP methyl ester carboxylesterase